MWVYRTLRVGDGPFTKLKVFPVGTSREAMRLWTKMVEESALEKQTTVSAIMASWNLNTTLVREYEAAIWLDQPEENEFGVVWP